MLPRKPKVEIDVGDSPRVASIEGDMAGEMIAALQSETAREIYAALNEEPRAASDLAEETDTTIQNVRHHLEQLEDAELVQVVDTWYSSRGREMDVYAPTGSSIVFLAEGRDADTVKEILKDATAGVGIVAAGAVLVQVLYGTLLKIGVTMSMGNPASTTTGTGTIPPGLLFFAGGLVVVLVGVAVAYHRSR